MIPAVIDRRRAALRLGQTLVCLLWVLSASRPSAAAPAASAGLQQRFVTEIQPLLKTYCLGCHSTEKQKGELDLEQFSSAADALKHAKIWQGVVEQMLLGEMPPKDKPQLTPAEREKFLAWVNHALDEAALARAGDPGPVVLRRLNNAEYTFTLRDLTGVASLDPAREFPADSAAGEGFMNTGNALVMSPALLTKYLDAAKDVAAHAVLLPDGLGFSPSTSQRDWTEERLAAIRAFYARYSINGGGSAVNLQGIKFDTKDGGVLDLAEYLAATLELRQQFQGHQPNAATAAALTELAGRRRLSAKYLTALWDALNGTNAPLLLDPLRTQWRTSKSTEASNLVYSIAVWQQALWRFTQVGHIGKRDGPKAWQVPVTPLAQAREVRWKLPAPAKGQEEVAFYLSVSDAGDGSADDWGLWENPRLLAPGRADLPLRDLPAAVAVLQTQREKVFRSAAQCLTAASEFHNEPGATNIAALARKHGVSEPILAAWLDSLGLGTGPARIESLITQKMESAQNYDFIKGWTGADALSVLANSSDQHVRVPGNMKPHGIAVHPAPKRRVLVGWRSPVATLIQARGAVQHAHPECGNGVTWALELRRGHSRQSLASGVSQGAKEIPFGPIEHLQVQAGDVLSLVIGPRDGNHSCDLTAIDLELKDATRTWNLSRDVSPNLLAGNPHADSLGNAAVWHFYSEPDKGGGADPGIPTGSILARWQSATNADQKARLGDELQRLLLAESGGPAAGTPDAQLRQHLTSLNGPLFRGLLRPENLAAFRTNETAPSASQAHDNRWGLAPGLFGTQSNGLAVNPQDLLVRAPSVLEVRLPAELAHGCEFVATARLHAQGGDQASVQMQATGIRPSNRPGLAAGRNQEQGGKSTWSDGERPVLSDSPILVRQDSAAGRRVAADLDAFRQLFPAALCYTKIVPVDEVVTLTLFYREDDHLRRLVLDDRATRELEQLWAELHYVSHDALKLVDAYEQLWQFATQDADPSAFEPMREPIKKRAEAFRQQLQASQPAHVNALVQFAEKAYRRPLAAAEQQELHALYQRLRSESLPHETAVRLVLARVLVAPAFLYRAEKPGPGDNSTPVNDWELATRLSYFLWSSAPDAELRALAAAGRLQQPDVLVAQTRRMLRDPRVRRLATEFACAWLHIHGFDELGEKSERHFPTFLGLRAAMYEETIRFFTDLFQRDGSVLDILDADHTFLNADLARHYGIPLPASAVAASDSNMWHRVSGLRERGRGGILAHATTLAKQSGASRTSPILRGNWVAEVLLGEKLPRPPKDVPQLPEDEATEQLTVRQLTEKHSNDPKCYGCHRRIDPYGYALEGFDAIGRRREQDLGGRPIDTRTRVMDGTELDGLDGMRRYLTVQRRDAFLKQYCRKLLGYSLGRGVLLSDGPLITEMRAQLKARNYQMSAAVEAIVRSRQFREIRGTEMPGDE
jgi:hypothetical protein